MKKTLIVVMELEVSDLSMDERKECAEIEDCKTSDLPRLNEIDAFEAAQALLPDPDDAEIFAGSGLYAKFTKARILAQSWKAKP